MNAGENFEFSGQESPSIDVYSNNVAKMGKSETQLEKIRVFMMEKNWGFLEREREVCNWSNKVKIVEVGEKEGKKI